MLQGTLPLDFSQCQRWRNGCERWRPAGELFNPRYASVQRIDTTLSKLRNGESGADYVEVMLRSMGAEARRLSESGADYVRRLIDTGFLRRKKHPGNLAFSWNLK